MPAAPRFTVVIPCFNAAGYVGDAIQSCLDQTARDLEVIVVDDGSTDGSAAVIDRAAARDARVRVIRQENKGLGAARNAGLAHARGEFINFLDADDLFEPDKLAAQGAVLTERRDVGLVLCNGIGFDFEERVVWKQLLDVRRFEDHPPLLDVYFRIGGPFPPLVPLVRRELALAVGGFDEDRAAAGWADSGFWMRVALTGTDYDVVDRKLACYRVLPTSMSADAERMERAAEIIFRKLLAEKPQESVRALRAAQRYTRALELALQQMEPREAEAQLHEARAAARHARHALLHLLAQTSRGPAGRPLLIWGAGAAGREVLAWLRRLGGDAEALIDSNPARSGSRVEGLPIVGPDTLHHRPGPRPFVVVASMHRDTIVAWLREFGWRDGADYYVADFDHTEILAHAGA
jgi:hypothetical protein